MKRVTLPCAALVTALMLAACERPEAPPREEDKALRRAVQEPIDKAKAAREAAEAAAAKREEAAREND